MSKELTKDELRVRVAKAAGGTVWNGLRGRVMATWLTRSNGDTTVIPNYPEDLNACAELRASLTEDEFDSYRSALCKILKCAWYQSKPQIDATAEQHCRAFLVVKETR